MVRKFYNIHGSIINLSLIRQIIVDKDNKQLKIYFNTNYRIIYQFIQFDTWIELESVYKTLVHLIYNINDKLIIFEEGCFYIDEVYKIENNENKTIKFSFNNNADVIVIPFDENIYNKIESW